jgi:transposase
VIATTWSRSSGAKAPGRAELGRITKLAEEHREELLEEWEKKALPTTKGSDRDFGQPGEREIRSVEPVALRR